MKIVVPMVPPSPNKMKRMHFFDYRTERDCWQRTMFAFMGRQPKLAGKAYVQIHIEHGRLFDPDNLVGAAKIPLDCLVRLGVLEGDSPAHLELSVTQEKSRERQTTISVEQIEKRDSV